MASNSLVFIFFAMALVLTADYTNARMGVCGNTCEVGPGNPAGGCNTGCSCKMTPGVNYNKRSNRGVGKCQPSKGRARRSKRH
uniref:8 kDa Amblyomma family member n=1 Tax=Rhipicephalus appendiculatus TaxID=34631 RepID=A0A131YGY5_RHIAP